MNNYGINDALSALGVAKLNKGSATGKTWLGSSTTASIRSYSPVDGALIGEVGVTSGQDYETVIDSAVAAKKFPLRYIRCPPYFDDVEGANQQHSHRSIYIFARVKI